MEEQPLPRGRVDSPEATGQRVGRIEYPFPLLVVAPARMERVDSYLKSLIGSSGLFSEPERSRRVAASYVAYCSPPNRADVELELSAHWMAMFFLVDDHPDLTCFSREAWRALNSFDVGMLDASLRSVVEFGELLRARARESNRRESSFLHAFREMLAAMTWEAKIPSGVVLSPQEHHRMRSHAVGCRAHLELWKFLGGLPVEAEIECGHALRRLERLVTEMIYLANDIASFEQDRRKGAQNMIVSCERHERLTLDEAKGRVVAMHDEALASFVRESSDLVATTRGCDGQVRGYVEFLGTCLRGNLQALVELRDRYAGWLGGN